MSFLRLEDLSLHHGRTLAVERLNLALPQGQLLSLLGPSGCGKTTSLRAVAGLLEPTSGRIELAGEDITRRPANRRDIGLVFQSYALFPHLSALENVAFGLRMRRVPEAELGRRAAEALQAVGLQGFEQRLPARLSGGQQQRVALARAIVIRPRLLLLDEPLSNLDAQLRVQMRAELRRIQRETGITMLYVTHDQEEALGLSDRIVVMHQGRVEQDATPQQVYRHPATPFVAAFMGWSNLFAWRDGLLRPAEAAPGDAGWPCPLPAALAAAPGQAPRHVAWRPEHVQVCDAAEAAAAGGLLPGRVLASGYQGECIEYLVQTTLGPVKAQGGVERAWTEGAGVALRLDAARAAWM